MLQGTLLRLLNHMLRGEVWARHRLLAFSGQSLNIESALGVLRFQITTEGYFEADTAANPPIVSITLPNDILMLLLRDPHSVFSQAQLNGPADFCESLAFVFRNLRWDAEADLAEVLGDIPARRLHAVLTGAFRWQRDTLKRFGAAVVEYSREENTNFPTRSAFTSHCDILEKLQTDLQLFETRLSNIRHEPQ